MGVKQLSDKWQNEKGKSDDDEIRELLESRKTQIKVVGCGGAGNNTITRLNQVGIQGAETIAVNTDAQDLLYTDADRKVLIGKELTAGLGAGADPNLGMESAKESKEELKKVLQGADMVFITCGLGGGTGTGSAPVVADIAKKLGALTIAVVTLPFGMEGKFRMANARIGLDNLEPNVDTLIVIPNDRLLEIVPDVAITTAFKVADEILVNAVKGISELVTKPGLVNLDFADVRAVMGQGGLALIGVGESNTDNRAFESIEKAINNPLINVDIGGATGALINVVGGPDITIREAQQICEMVSTKLSEDAKIIWGAQVDKSLGDAVRTMLVITGVKSSQVLGMEKVSEKKPVREGRRKVDEFLGIEVVE